MESAVRDDAGQPLLERVVECERVLGRELEQRRGDEGLADAADPKAEPAAHPRVRGDVGQTAGHGQRPPAVAHVDDHPGRLAGGNQCVCCARDLSAVAAPIARGAPGARLHSLDRGPPETRTERRNPRRLRPNLGGLLDALLGQLPLGRRVFRPSAPSARTVVTTRPIDRRDTISDLLPRPARPASSSSRLQRPRVHGPMPRPRFDRAARRRAARGQARARGGRAGSRSCRTAPRARGGVVEWALADDRVSAAGAEVATGRVSPGRRARVLALGVRRSAPCAAAPEASAAARRFGAVERELSWTRSRTSAESRGRSARRPSQRPLPWRPGEKRGSPAPARRPPPGSGLQPDAGRAGPVLVEGGEDLVAHAEVGTAPGGRLPRLGRARQRRRSRANTCFGVSLSRAMATPG